MMKDFLFCRQCGFPLKADDLFCPECGAKSPSISIHQSWYHHRAIFLFSSFPCNTQNMKVFFWAPPYSVRYDSWYYQKSWGKWQKEVRHLASEPLLIGRDKGGVSGMSMGCGAPTDPVPWPGEINASVSSGGGVVVFRLSECDQLSYREVVGEVPPGIDFSDDALARSALEKAARFAQENCPKTEPFSNIKVFLQRGGQNLVVARNYERNRLTWQEYHNSPYEKRIQEERARAEAARRRAEEEARRREEEAQRVAEERKKAEAIERFNEFTSKNGVKKWVQMEELAINPFLYQDETVTVLVNFEEMTSEDTGLFSRGSNMVLVSDIPRDVRSRLTARYYMLLACRVQGKTTVQLPLLGSISVPHVQFVGTHFCNDARCSDLLYRGE